MTQTANARDYRELVHELGRDGWHRELSHFREGNSRRSACLVEWWIGPNGEWATVVVETESRRVAFLAEAR